VRGRIRFCPRCGGRTSRRQVMGIKRYMCDSCDEVFYDNPLCAVAVMAVKDGRLLLVKRAVGPAKGFWALPGGFIEQGESPEKAGLRELKEETGVTAESAKIICVKTEHTAFFGTLIIIGVIADCVKGCLKPGDDASDARWFETNEMPFVVFRSHREIIKMCGGPGSRFKSAKAMTAKRSK